MESKTKNKKTRQEIERMAAKAFTGLGLAAGDDAVQELKEGWFNASYAIRLADGRQVVLKIAPPPHVEIMTYERDIMATEVAAMRLVAQNPAIPVPEIYFYDDDHDVCDSDYFFMAKVEGENLNQMKAKLPLEPLEPLELQIGGIIREINTFPGTYFGYPGNPDLRAETWREAFIKIVESVLEDAARKEVAFDFNYDDFRSVLEKHAPALDEIIQPCLVHWDGWSSNIFVREGRVVGLIDFERALWAEPLMEAQFRLLADGGLPNSLRGYGKTSFTPSEDVRNHLYALHLALVMHTECYYRDYDTDEIFNFSRGYLERTMAWLQAN
jgi:aminoglycoside phosphotransferase (APT) family kinase protein